MLQLLDGAHHSIVCPAKNTKTSNVTCMQSNEINIYLTCYKQMSEERRPGNQSIECDGIYAKFTLLYCPHPPWGLLTFCFVHVYVHQSALAWCKTSSKENSFSWTLITSQSATKEYGNSMYTKCKSMYSFV